MPQGLIQPNNAILYNGDPLIHEYEVKTVTTMYPGRLVIHDTNEWDIKVADSGSVVVLGVLDIEATELRTTIYGQYDQARVLNGDIVVLLTKDSGGAIEEGTRLAAGNSGMVQPASAIHISGGAVIGFSKQVVAVGTKARVLVKLLI